MSRRKIEKYGECVKIKCEGGKIELNSCICPNDYILIHGKCVVKTKCVGGRLINNKCYCNYDKKLINGICVKKKIQ